MTSTFGYCWWPCDQRITHSLLLCHILSNVQDFKRRAVAYPDHAKEKRFLPYKIFRPPNLTFISRSQIIIHKWQYLRPNQIILHFWKNIGEKFMTYRELDSRATMMIKRSTVELKKFMCRRRPSTVSLTLPTVRFLDAFFRDENNNGERSRVVRQAENPQKECQ